MDHETRDLYEYARVVGDRDRRVIAAVAAGLPKTEVARCSGLARSTVDRVFSAHGLDAYAIDQHAAAVASAWASTRAHDPDNDPETDIGASPTPSLVEVGVSLGDQLMAYKWSPSEEEWAWVREGALSRIGYGG